MRKIRLAAVLALVLAFPAGLLAATPFSCVISAATADAVCQASPGAGLSLYISTVVVSNGGTAQTVRLITGTGTTCGTSTDVVVPLLNLAVNGTVDVTFGTPLVTARNEDLCADISGTTAYSVVVSGFIAP